MPTGDTLTVIGLALAAMIGALTTSDARARFLWVLTAFFVALAFVYAGAIPHVSLSPPSLAWIGSAVTALVAPVTIGVVAMMLRELRPRPSTKTDLATLVDPKPLPEFAVSPSKRSKWEPDIEYREALSYYLTQGPPRRDIARASLDEFISMFHIELRSGKIVAWGKAHPGDAEMVQIRTGFWQGAQPTIKTNYVFSNTLNAAAFDVHLSKAQLELVWPPKPEENA